MRMEEQVKEYEESALKCSLIRMVKGKKEYLTRKQCLETIEELQDNGKCPYIGCPHNPFNREDT